MRVEQGAVDLGIPGLTNAVEVARGGFSTIYRATQSTMERTVAVKLIHATVVDPVAGEHFLREVRATGRLSQHPNVAPVYDVGTTSSGQPYLLMPYYEHGSLQQRITANGALSEAEAVRLARTLAGTLDYVHNRGIVHRDVKPANVLLSESQEPLLADFGVARLVDGSVPMHTTGANVVTWAYGPPEAFTGGPPTAAWDIYSLGATVYAMLTGQPPFVDGEDVNVFTVLNRIGNVEVPDLRDRGVSPAVADAVRQTMAKEPTDRPATAAEFAALLTPPLPPPRTARTEPEPEPEPVAVALMSADSALSAEISDTNVEEPHIEPEPELAPVPEPATVAVEPEPEPAPVAVEPEPEPEPVAVALMSADAALSAEVPDTNVEEPHIEPEPVAAAFVSTDSALSAEIPDASVGEGPVAVTADAPVAPRRRSRTVDIVTLLGAAALLVNLVAVQSNVYNGYGSVFFGGVIEDFDFWIAPLALAVGLVIVRLRPGVGYEWLIGAASSFVLLDIGINLIFLANESDVSDGFPILRLVAALLAIGVVVLSWRQAAVPGPRINLVLGGLLALGAVFAVSGMRDYGRYVGLPAYMWPVLAMVVVLLVRGFAFPARTTGAPALVAGGVVGVVTGVAEGQWSDWDKLDSVLVLIVGFAVITVVGILRWRQSELAET
ncbi:MAG TPA: serine/threonine-protein kinase [Acidimicrobiales bacterium]|nr:serine/threonine-protein kinase [Acidimicrobiales bacterium]